MNLQINDIKKIFIQYKKIVILCICVVFVFGVAGCGNKEKQKNRLQRISKEYTYELIGEVEGYKDWFVVSDELFCLRGHYDMEEGRLKEVGNLEHCYMSSYDSKWLVFESDEGVLKYNIENQELDLLISKEKMYDKEGYYVFDKAVVANNALYYTSTKTDPSKAEDKTHNAIWRIDLISGEDKKVIENARDETGLLADFKNHDIFYFSGDCGNIIRYDCVSGEQVVVEEGFMYSQYYLTESGLSENRRYSIDGYYYTLKNDALYLWKDGKEICIKEDCQIPSSTFQKNVVYSNGYLVLITTDEIIIVDKENVYDIQREQDMYLDSDNMEVMFVKDNEIWFQYIQYGAGIEGYFAALFFSDFRGNMSKSDEEIYMDSGKAIGYVDGNIIIAGVVIETWEINVEVDSAIINELKAEGFNVASYGTFEEGKTEFDIYVTEEGRVYRLKID